MAFERVERVNKHKPTTLQSVIMSQQKSVYSVCSVDPLEGRTAKLCMCFGQRKRLYGKLQQYLCLGARNYVQQLSQHVP